MDPLKMYLLLKMGIFHCYVSLPEGILYVILWMLSLEPTARPWIFNGWKMKFQLREPSESDTFHHGGKIEERQKSHGVSFSKLSRVPHLFWDKPKLIRKFPGKNLHGLIHTFIDLSGWCMLFRKASFSSLNFPVLVRARAKKNRFHHDSKY